MRILIADDESIIRLGLKTMLQEMGHEVLAATNGREALAMARRHQPDLAILDIKMPVTDGLQAARALARSRPIPVLLLTAYSEQELVDRAADLPIHGYLLKPVDPNALRAAIAVAGRRFAEHQSLAARADQLAESLEGRKLVDRAKGRLIAAGLDESSAYRHIQRRARDRQISLAAAAREILKERPD